MIGGYNNNIYSVYSHNMQRMILCWRMMTADFYLPQLHDNLCFDCRNEMFGE